MSKTPEQLAVRVATDPHLCPHCFRGVTELVPSINMPKHLEQRRCLVCGKSTVYVKSCELANEENRWWQAFCAAYRPVCEVTFTDPKPSLEEAAQLCAEGAARGADAMIAEARKLGRV